MMPPAHQRSVSSNAFARQRDAQIEWLLATHPATAAMLVALRLFPTKAKALRRLRRLVKRQRVRLIGTVQRHAGRPEHVFHRGRLKLDDLEHEVELTEVCLRFDAEKLVRGPAQVDPKRRPDAEMWINGQPYALELDRSTMGYAQMQQRFALYIDYPHFVLWVCRSRERCEGLRSLAHVLAANSLFAVFADVVTSPHRPIWRSVAGTTVALPRQQRTSS